MTALQLSTHLGPVDALEFGDAGAPLVVCIQGKSANLDVITEWQPAACELAAAGLRVTDESARSERRFLESELSGEEGAGSVDMRRGRSAPMGGAFLGIVLNTQSRG